jgi:hypothetical protein
VWILENETFRSWLGSNTASLLWLWANLGCGKSVLAAFLVYHFTSLSQRRELGVYYFFFKPDDVGQ